MRLVQALLGLSLVALMFGESQQFGAAKSGPYDVIMQRVYLCDDQGNKKLNANISLYLGEADGSKIRKRLHRGGFSWLFTKEESKAIGVDVEIYQKKNSDYLLMYAYHDTLCKATELAKETYISLEDASGMNKEDGCLISQGDYSFNDWEIPFNLPTPMLEYGPYKATLKILDRDEVIGCVSAMGDVVPKSY